MSATLVLPPVAEGYLPRKKFTRAEVYRMLELGLFEGRRFELINGDVIDKMGQSARHSYSIRKFAAMLAKHFDPATVQVQSPIEVFPSDRQHSEPEPDIVVLTQDMAGYQQRHPRGDELQLVVEVADSSLRGDLTIKRDLYARAGVPEYWVLDIVANRLIAHRQPSGGVYAEIVSFTESDSVPIPGAAGQMIALASLFASS